MFLRTGVFFSSILSEFLKNLVALQQEINIYYKGIGTLEMSKVTASMEK